MMLGSIGDCTVGAPDANGNTIASCGSEGGPGGGISLPPTCMPGDTAVAQDGYWACVPGGGSSLGSLGLLIPIGLLVVVAVIGMRK